VDCRRPWTCRSSPLAGSTPPRLLHFSVPDPAFDSTNDCRNQPTLRWGWRLGAGRGRSRNCADDVSAAVSAAFGRAAGEGCNAWPQTGTIRQGRPSPLTSKTAHSGMPVPLRLSRARASCTVRGSSFPGVEVGRAEGGDRCVAIRSEFDRVAPFAGRIVHGAGKNRQRVWQIERWEACHTGAEEGVVRVARNDVRFGHQHTVVSQRDQGLVRAVHFAVAVQVGHRYARPVDPHLEAAAGLRPASEVAAGSGALATPRRCAAGREREG